MKSGSKFSKVAVVGSGVSGISAAYYLKKKGYKVDIIESSSSIGGRIGSCKMGDQLIDFGGKNIGYGYRLFREFVADQGNFSYEYFGVNTSKVVDGRLISINREKNFKSLVNILRLSSPIDLLKLFYLVKRIRKDPKEGLLGSNFYNSLSDRFDHNPLTSYFGEKFCDNILRPMTVRMNGSEPDKCFVGNLGSNIRIAFDKYDQIREGIGSVINTFAARSEVKYNLTVHDLIVRGDKVVGIRVSDSDGKNFTLEYDAVVLALPSYATSEVLKTSIPSACQYLNLIRYNPVGIMIVKYKNPVFSSEVRAMVFDSNSALSNAGAYGVNDLNLVRYTFSGRTADKIINKDTAQGELFDIIKAAMPDSFNIQNNEIVDCSYRYFRNGLCSYSPYHYKNLEKISIKISEIDGLFLTGDYFCGASIEACFNSSKVVTDRLVNFNE